MSGKGTASRQRMAILIRKSKLWGLLSLFLFLFITVPAALAHGAVIELAVVDDDTVAIHAEFDTGEPMSEAQIIVYAADNPREAWLTGVADENGEYTFDLDTSLAGRWSVTVRTAGHGDIRYLYVANNGAIELEEISERPAWLTFLMAAGVVIVLGGTAYWYSRPKAGSKTEAKHART